MKSRLPIAAAFLAVLALTLGGCDTLKYGSQKGKMCPTAAVLADTAALTVFRPNAQFDPAGELYTVRMTGVKTDCLFDKDEGQTDSHLTISFRATRPPSGGAASYKFPYYVVVTQADKIVDKRNFVAEFTFASNAMANDFDDEVESTVIRLPNGKTPFDYQILVGMQLTEGQRDYNKKMGRYAP